MKKLLILISLLIFLNGCIPISVNNEATHNQQQEVKTEVLKALEEYYKQPFEVESFEYKYKKHENFGRCQGDNCGIMYYGTYYFKVKAVNNPIIVMNFNFNDGLATKESIKESLLYCIYKLLLRCKA